MAERRKFKRVELDVAVRCKITDPKKKTDISGEIIVKAKNLSEGGALLEWPRSWLCDTCSNCLAWVYNFTCNLKEKGPFDEESNKVLIPEVHINLHLVPAGDVEPVSTLAKVAWVKVPPEQEADKYHVGVIFLGEKKEPDFRKKITVIKKRFEAD
ncbi:MAG: hypothetical protein AMJ78_05775 [Omnitrophica WOR_2 bacterium SM23_29]|nr:MAG: hypothetical protein AMJ78_05775 [Omnitrophica WOR_2 bacterium SM23_29]